MSSDIDAQAEERESLHAIYDTDCEYDPDACSYKVGSPAGAVLLLLLLLLRRRRRRRRPLSILYRCWSAASPDQLLYQLPKSSKNIPPWQPWLAPLLTF
jgi:hypothetical protein